MSATVSNMRFFFKTGVLEWLVNKNKETETLGAIEKWDFSYDIIDQPFACSVDCGQTGGEMKVYIRSELGAHWESPDLQIKLNIKEDDIGADLIGASPRLGNAQEIALSFISAALSLGKQAEEAGLQEEFADLDIESEGIVVTLENDALSFRRVSGKARPAMACTTLFGGVQMVRPYQDEIMDSWMSEMMSIEEKEELAEDGDEDMMEQLALAYLNGDDDVEQNPERAAFWFTKLAELDNSDAQFNLGLFYAKGFGVERSFEQALYWMEKAEENGDTDAPGLIEKLRKGVAAQKIVSTGDAQAQADLAEVYMFIGKSLDQGDKKADFAIAFDMAQKSAAQDNGDGIWALALCYEHGRGVGQDVEKAVELYRRGAELGHAPSQHSLACYYFRGDVVKKDNKKAFALCMQSAEQGYGLAMRDVGRCYQFGNGVMGNMKTATEWYEKSLEVLYDEELARKTELFKMMGEADEHWGEDYPGDPDEDDFDEGDFDEEQLLEEGFEIPDVITAAFEAAEEYENELAQQGILPDAPMPGTVSFTGFERVEWMAEQDDVRAQKILAQLNAIL